MIGGLVVAALAVAALVYVILPLGRVDQIDLMEGPSPEAVALEDKNIALTAIIDLKEEAQVGKLSPEEHQRLRQGYESDALDALERLDTLSVPIRSDDPLEQEIAAMKQRLACPSCGALRSPGGTCTRCEA